MTKFVNSDNSIPIVAREDRQLRPEPTSNLKIEMISKAGQSVDGFNNSTDPEQPQSTKKLSAYENWLMRARRIKKERLEQESVKMIVLKFLIAPIICVIYSLFLYLTLDYHTFTQVGGGMLIYFFPPLGKESVIPGGIAVGLHPLLIGLSIAFVDIATALFLLWNYDFTKLIPVFGRLMEWSEKKGTQKFQDNPWLENLAFIGLILFVVFPFQGSGGVGTSILGRVVGMNKYKVFVAITIGAVTGCLFIAYASNYILDIFKTDIFQGLKIMLIAIGLIAVFYLAYRYLTNNINKKTKKV